MGFVRKVDRITFSQNLLGYHKEEVQFAFQSLPAFPLSWAFVVSNPNEFLSIINKVRGGASDAAGELLEPYRNYLRMLAAAQLAAPLGKRVSPSDIVQDAMLAAHQNIVDFRGNTPSEFTVWLRTILTRCLLRAVERNTKASKRDIRREVSLRKIDQAMGSSCVNTMALIASDSPTPSQIVSGEEETVRVANLLAKLSADYQQVIALRNFGNMRFEEVAREMDRSETAVRLLWLRAVRKLRELYQATDH